MSVSQLYKEKIAETMSKRLNIRNMCVIAHVDHGKSTLTDALVSRAGLIPESQAGNKRFTDSREDEIERGITIKSSAVSMFFDVPEAKLEGVEREGNGFLVNLIDSPGHIDFNSEVTAALRVTDGALVVVDVVSGCSCQTETVLRQALGERVKPVLIINKMDRAILEQKLDPETLYQRVKRIIEQVNYLIYVYSGVAEEELEDVEEEIEQKEAEGEEVAVEKKPTTTKDKFKFECESLDPTKGNVAFASGVDGWAFTLTHFAEMYAKKLKLKSASAFVDKLWGENYYNAQTKKWQTRADKESQRGFNQYVLEPIYKALNMCLENQYEKLSDISDKMETGWRIKEADKDTLRGKELMRNFMKRWLPAADAMLELVVRHLPSPVQAQKYRVAELYEGPLDDPVAVGIRECDSQAPLIVYISKMIPSNADKSKFLAFGRCFSGTVEAGMEVRIMGPNYKVGSDTDLYIKPISRGMISVGEHAFTVDRIPCGNVVALVGIDKFLDKSGTLTTYKQAHCIKNMRFTVSPIVQVAVEPVNAADLPKLIEGLKRLQQSDSLVRCFVNKEKQHIIAGAGELHLDICVKDLRKVYAKVDIRTSEPVVTYKETVSDTSDQVCLAKTANKLNRIFMTAQPLSEAFCADVDERVKLNPNQDVKQRAKYLQETHGFDIAEAKKIWCFGPNQFDANILVDVTKGVPSAQDVTETIVAGFQWGSEEGILCGESLRGVRFNLVDLMYHQDAAHRKGSQMLPAVRRAMMSSMLTAKPRLLEPVFLVDIQCPETCKGAIYSLLNKKRGEIFEEMPVQGTLLYNVKAYLPVNESSGFTEELRGATSGKAFPQCSFHHWQLMPGDPYDVTSKAGQICAQTRRQRHMREEMPQLADYLDKL